MARTRLQAGVAVVLLVLSASAQAGNPFNALNRKTRDRIVNFIEWSFQAPLTQSQRARMEQIVESEWKTESGREDMKGWLDAADETDKFPPEQKPLVREKLLEVMLPALRDAAKTDEDARWFLGVWEAANKPLVAGPPPLTRQAVEATVEMLYFTLTKAHGFEASPTKAEFDAAAKDLVAAWPKLTAERKREVASTPMQWANLRAAWDAASQADRDEVAAGWREAFPLPEVKPSPFSTTPGQRAALAKLKEVEAYLEREPNTWTAADMQRLSGELGQVAQTLRGESGGQALADKLAGAQAGLNRWVQQKNAAQAQQTRAAIQQSAQQSSNDLARRMAAQQMMNQAFQNQMAFQERMRQQQFNMIQNLGNNPYRYGP
jgi:hypothetical protein